MYKEPEAMKEIHDIREQLSRELKGLSEKEVISKIRKEAEGMRKKYGLKLKQHTST